MTVFPVVPFEPPTQRSPRRPLPKDSSVTAQDSWEWAGEFFFLKNIHFLKKYNCGEMRVTYTAAERL